MVWMVEIVPAAKKAIEELPETLSVKLVRMLESVKSMGPSNLCTLMVRHLDGKLWALRVNGKDGVARGIYARFPVSE